MQRSCRGVGPASPCPGDCLPPFFQSLVRVQPRPLRRQKGDCAGPRARVSWHCTMIQHRAHNECIDTERHIWLRGATSRSLMKQKGYDMH